MLHIYISQITSFFSNKIIVKKVEILQVTIKTDLFFFFFEKKKTTKFVVKPNCPIVKTKEW